MFFKISMIFSFVKILFQKFHSTSGLVKNYFLVFNDLFCKTKFPKSFAPFFLLPKKKVFSTKSFFFCFAKKPPPLWRTKKKEKIQSFFGNLPQLF